MKVIAIEDGEIMVLGDAGSFERRKAADLLKCPEDDIAVATVGGSPCWVRAKDARRAMESEIVRLRHLADAVLEMQDSLPPDVVILARFAAGARA
jgi:hypothetical protein